MIQIDPNDFNLPDIDENYEVFITDLSDFPHSNIVNNINYKGKNGLIYFYDVDPKIKTLSFSSKTNSIHWSSVDFYSVHPKRRLLIVTLENGYQIFTDDDPRAIFGYNEATQKWERNTPNKAFTLELKVPIYNFKDKTTLKYNENDFSFPIEEQDLFEARDLQFEFYQRGILTIISYNKESKLFNLNPVDIKTYLPEYVDEVNVAKIKEIEDTGLYLEGYDLTVPKDDTFLSYNGIVLSNTMNVHVPALPEAQEELRMKLLPSKQIFSPRDNRNIVNKLKQDYILGLNSQATKPSENKWIFKSQNELIKAINEGKVKLSDEIAIIPEK